MKSKREQTVVTLVLLGLLVVLAAVPALRLSSSPDAGRGTGSARDQDIRHPALQLHRCVNSRVADSARCEGEFLRLLSALDGEAGNSLDFREAGFVEVLVKEEILILRRTACAPDDLAGRVIGWSVWSKTEKARRESDIKYGLYTGYREFDAEGRRFGTTCLLVIVLPISDLKRLYVALLDASKTVQLWKLDHEW